ncbi:futalosine hydrolase [Phaeodactylibacter xiamenensis]|uniref:futalosine hydrolase n=1 Tax=Phaeodactylibacter xiamenensis TaxID=1524460 RepID=UPI003BA8CD52
MNILIVAATPFEIAALRAHLQSAFVQTAEHQFQKGDVKVALLITGVGLPLTGYALGRVLALEEWNLVINAGIAGSLSAKFSPGSVVQVVTERFADLGVEEADGRFTSVHEMGLIEKGQPPFDEQGRMPNQHAQEFDFLPQAHGISVNRVHGSAASIEQLRQQYPDAEIESMEGAAFFYACLMEKVPFLEIRSVSNFVEPRNRDNWKVEEALSALNKTLIELLQSLFTSY